MDSPPVTNIEATAWREFGRSVAKFSWLIVPLGILYAIFVVTIGYYFFSDTESLMGGMTFEGYIYIGLPPLITIIVWYTSFAIAAREKFWRQFADSRTWSYIQNGNLEEEVTLMAQEGHSQSMKHIVAGMDRGRSVRMYEFEFSKGHGRGRRDFFYTVFEFTFAGEFPHIYLNYKSDWYSISKSNKVSLPSAFEKEFAVYAPLQYEIEALEIFTPDVMHYLLDAKWSIDIELVGNRLMMFRKNHVTTRHELEEEYARAWDLVERMAPCLDRMRFSKIGDHTTSLQ